MRTKVLLSAFLCSVLLHAQSVDADFEGFDTPTEAETPVSTAEDVMDGFDDAPTNATQVQNDNADDMEGFNDTSTSEVDETPEVISGLTGKLTEQVALSL
ncbi:MAG TPA: hypothetical protein ENJ34_00280, partial [Epsilonproteobacteria bacterium]|nr:hypothetical protein [Campylobacterota bacterium]